MPPSEIQKGSIRAGRIESPQGTGGEHHRRARAAALTTLTGERPEKVFPVCVTSAAECSRTR